MAASIEAAWISSLDYSAGEWVAQSGFRMTRRHAGFGLLAIALVIGGQVFWNNALKDDFVPKRFVEVLPGHLYRSGQISAPLIEGVLRDHQIEIVIDLNGPEEKWQAEQAAEARAVADLGIQYFRMPLRGDGTGDLEMYARAIREIERARKDDKAILVHCAAGARRTGGVVASYRMLVEGAPRDVVLSEMGRYGSDLSSSRLLAYVDDNKDLLVRRLVEMGVVDRLPESFLSLRP